MKKLFAILLAFVMAATFAACGAQEEQHLPTVKEEAPATTVEEVPPSAAVEEVQPDAPIEEAQPGEGLEAANLIATIEAKDCYGNAGYVEFVSGAEQATEYTFTAEDSDAVTWRVYVLDESFEEGFRYIAQAAEPVLEGDGTVSVAEGQFVYVYCSANEFTTDAADETAKLNVTVK